MTENIFSSNNLPLRIVVGLTETQGVVGSYTKNPFNFAAHGLTKFSLSIDNIALEYRTLNLNYENGHYLLGYQQFLNGLNIESTTIGINRDYFLDGHVFYVYQLQNYESASNFFAAGGQLRLDMSFEKPLETAVTAVILAQTQNVLTVDKYRNITVENQGVLQ